MSERLARCTEPSCPVRYRTGRDRDCGQHQDTDDDLVARMMAMGATMAAAPGERDGVDGDSDDWETLATGLSLAARQRRDGR